MRVTPPASVWLSVSEKSEMPTTTRSKTGMMKTEDFSMPFSTPLYTIRAVRPRKIRLKIRGALSAVIKAPKNLESAAACPAPLR